MTYRHGVYMSEVPTQLRSMLKTTEGVTVVVGLAPVHLAEDPASVNEPVKCTTYNEAVRRLGYSTDTATYTLCEAMDVLMGLYQVSPVVFINVFDPAKHNETLLDKVSLTMTGDKKNEFKYKNSVAADIIKSSVQVIDGDGDVYEIKSLTISGDTIEGELAEDLTGQTKAFKLSAASAAPTKVNEGDLVGNTDSNGKSRGLWALNEVYPRFGNTIGQVVALPATKIVLSDVTPQVLAVALEAKCSNINGHFTALGLCDLQENIGSVKTSSPHVVLCYPAVKYGDKVQHLSVHVAGLMQRMATNTYDVPYESPSNHELYITGMCDLMGNDKYFGLDEANELNAQGILTVTNFNGWRCWGNRTSAYPSTTDPKDCWISVRRMFDYVIRTLTLTFWSKIDTPILKRNVDSVVESANNWFNGLVSQGALLGGRVVFSEDENSNQNLMDGILTFHCYITPPSPAEEIRFTMEYDPSYQSTIFEG